MTLSRNNIHQSRRYETTNAGGSVPEPPLDAYCACRRFKQQLAGDYDTANLWAATGWFLERFRQNFAVPDRVLARIERQRPRSPQYLERGHRGGAFASRWNLIVPEVLMRPGEADES